MPDDEPIVIIGVGARTPLGLSVTTSAAAVRAGISLVQDHPFMVDRFGEPVKVCRDAFIELEVRGERRASELALVPALDALSVLRAAWRTESVWLILATGEARPGQAAGHAAAVYEALASKLVGDVRLSGGEVVANGHAGGIFALSHAGDLLARGDARLCLVGGVDTYLEPETLEWLDDTEQLHSDGNRYGFCPGEAAAFCLLSTRRTARELGCRPLVELAAVATAREDNRIKTDTVCVGDGLGEVFRTLFELAPDASALVDRIVCDMNGERYRANEYGFAVLRSPRRFRDAADFETPADCWGDVGAASGPLFVALVSEAYARGYAKGPLSVVWASSEGGARAAALLRQPSGED